jgi:beta-glucosidase
MWLQDQGGWQNKKIIEYFSRYSNKIVGQLGAGVKFWITQNETNVYTGNGCLKGKWPPGFKSLTKYLRANHHLSQAHIAAFNAIKEINPSAQIGVAHNLVYFSRISAGIKKYIYNRLYLNSISRHQDFVGVNYYISDRNTKDHSDMDWPTDKDGLYFVLKDVSRYKRPLYIFENGIADAADTKRAKYIKEHISMMKKAMDEGVDVRGYFYWSLLDNFEWDKGFWPRFGLVKIDYKTQERKIRLSAWEYKKIIEKGSLL